MRIAVLGCGSIGQRHLRNLQTLGCRDLVAFDPGVDARQLVEAELGVPAVATLDEAWKHSPQTVLVAAPSNLHVPLALEAARRGCHLFIEKPLSHSLDGVDELMTEVDRRGLITMVGCNMRFHPGPATVKKLLDERVIGDVIAARIQSGSYLPRWRPKQDYRNSYSASAQHGGTVLDCIHEIDLALWYFGPATVVASAHLPATSLGLKTDGVAEIILRHDSGALSSVHLNFVQRDYRRGCQIIGSDGTIYWDFMTHQVQVYGPDGQLARTIAEPAGWELNQMYVDEMSHFRQAIAGPRATMSPLSGGVAALRIALQARST